MLTAVDSEFVVYRGFRAATQRAVAAWSPERRARYLLRQDVRLPLSLDRVVWEEVQEAQRGALELVATVVPTLGSRPAVAKWRGSMFYHEVLPNQAWQRLGYDVCDEVGLSGLTNCGYENDERQKECFALGLNGHHLFRELEAADEFRAYCDGRVSEHAPFVVIALYAKHTQLDMLAGLSAP